MRFDVILKNGLIVDGTGSAGKQGDVGIVGDKITAIGNLEGAEADRTVDITGKVVSPGFIDVHVHSELELLEGQDKYAPLKMGVTTQMAGPDGFSWAALSKQRMKEMKDYLHPFYNYRRLGPDRDLSVSEFLDLFHGNLPSNLALQVPHGPIRLEVMGWDTRPANEDEIKRMEAMTREWLEAGSKAFCTGLEYEPMRRADLNELVRLSKVTAEYDKIYVSHQRGYGPRLDIGMGETLAIARGADIPVHVSHFGLDENAVAYLDKAKAEGLEVTFDSYPYAAGCTHMLLNFPYDTQAGSPDQVKERLKSRAFRDSIAQHLEATIPEDRLKFAYVNTPEPSGWEGKSLGEVKEELGLSLTDTVCEILLQSDMQALLIYHWAEEQYPNMERSFKHSQQMISTDGIYMGKKPHPRGYGTYPKVLREIVQEKQWITMEEAIYKMTGFPAKQFRLKQRGLLEEGYYADIVVFDPQTIRDKATFEEPRQDPEGIELVMVNGQVMVDKGVVQEGHPGRVLD